MDAVYLLGPSRSRELLYSLRSLANLPQVDRVVIAGWLPSCVKNVVHLPVRQERPGKHWSTWANLSAAAWSPKVSTEFVLMNDDFFITERVEQLPVYEAGPLSDRFTRPDDERTGRRCSVRSVLAGMGLVEPLGGWRSYELHVPMPVNRIALADVLERTDKVRPVDQLPAGKRSLYGNAVGVTGTEMRDVKIRDMSTVPPDGARFVSTHEFTFRSGAVGQWIRDRFPKPCRYERT